MASEIKLKPCPCCGGHATMEHGAERPDNGWVVCMECGLSTRYHHDPAEAAAEWNRREAVTPCNRNGNAAAMREALVKIRRELNTYCKDSTLIDRMTEDPPDYTCLRDSLLEIERIMDAALSAPARNCDLYANDAEAQFACLGESLANGVHGMSLAEYHKWLFAEAKGEYNESKKEEA